MTLRLCMVLAFYVALTGVRLPDWRSDVSVWRAAVQTDPDSPWALNNAAMTARDGTSGALLMRLFNLSIPAWMPDRSRQTYVLGYLNLANALREGGHIQPAETVMAHAAEIAPALFFGAKH